ncbi:MAG TPA: response regulator [Candidatus Obscuribacterales bacterium]
MAQFLFLEENRRQFEQVKQCLQERGHKAWQADKAASAFDFLSQYGVDVIISAINLENSDVFEFLRRVKESEKLKKIPVVFFCADEELGQRYATAVITKAGKTLGARKYILLPQFDGNRFWDELEECIPSTAQKNDALGGEVKTYSMTEFAWTQSIRKAG